MRSRWSCDVSGFSCHPRFQPFIRPLRTSRRSSNEERSGTVQPDRSYSSRHWSTNPLAASALAARDLREQQLRADVLVVARVVALVELVAPAELGAHRVPQELHHLHPLLGGLSLGATEQAGEQ